MERPKSPRVPPRSQEIQVGPKTRRCYSGIGQLIERRCMNALSWCSESASLSRGTQGGGGRFGPYSLRLVENALISRQSDNLHLTSPAIRLVAAKARGTLNPRRLRGLTSAEEQGVRGGRRMMRVPQLTTGSPHGSLPPCRRGKRRLELSATGG